MKIFNEPNLSGGWACPICKTADVKSVVLIPIIGTEDGNKMRAEQVHMDCLNLYMKTTTSASDRLQSLIYQIFDKE